MVAVLKTQAAMQDQSKKWCLKVAAGILALQILLPLASVVCLQQFFGYPVRTIYYHGIFLTFANLALATFAVGMTVFMSPRSRRWYLVFGLWGVFFVALYFIHLLTWIGSLYGGHPFSFEVALPYIFDPGSLKGFTNPALVWTGLLVLPGMIFAFYLLAAPLLGRFTCKVLGWARAVPTLLRRNRWRTLAGAVAVVIVATSLNRFWPIEEWKASYVEPGVGALANTGYTFNGWNTASDGSGTAYAGSSSTFGGLLSILRSRHVFNMQTKAFALQDVLKKAGYRVHFLLGGDHTHYGSLKYYFGTSMDTFEDGNSWRGYPMNDDSGVLAELARMSDFEAIPTFFYFHLMSVHEAGIRHPENEIYQPAAGSLGDVAQFTNHNDNGLIQADKIIRDLLGALDRKGFLENSLVVITSDHGQSLGEKGVFGHAKNLHREELAIPLLVLDPEGKKIPNFSMVRQIDIAPTLLDRIGLPIPKSWDGASLYRQASARFSYHQLLNKIGVIDSTEERTLKYTFDADHGTEELYNLTLDPWEAENLTADKATLAAMRAELQKFRK